MKIKHVYAHNVMGVDEVDLSLEGHHLFLIGGKNGQGKSSALNAIAMALCGKRGCDFPSDAVKHGERTAVVRIDLEDAPAEWFNPTIRVERRLEKRADGSCKDTLVIMDEDGEQAPTPQRLLDELFKHRGFDPLAFSRMRPAEQIDELRKVVEIDFESFDERRQELYQERTAVGREVKTLKGKLDGMKRLDAPEEFVSVAELTEELSRRTEVNRGNAERRSELEQHRAEYRRAMQESEQANARVIELKAQLAAASNHAAAAKNEKDRLEEEGIRLKEEVEKLVDADLQEITSQINQAEQINEAIRHNRARKELRAELDAKEDAYRDLTARIEEVDEDKANAIREAAWPVDGLSFDGTQIRYKDVPFSQCSASERIRVSVAMGIAANPQLPLLIISNGECLDNDTLREIEQAAKEHGYQILVEFMTRDADDEQRCQVIIEAGRSREPATA